MLLAESANVSAGASFTNSAPHVLFTGPYSSTIPLRSYDVTPDGHFVMSHEARAVAQPVTSLNVALYPAGLISDALKVEDAVRLGDRYTSQVPLQYLDPSAASTPIILLHGYFHNRRRHHE